MAALVVSTFVAIGGAQAASAQAPEAPVLTDLEAYSTFLDDPCCFITAEVAWAVDPTAPAPTRYEVHYQGGGYDQTHHPSPDALWTFVLDAPPDTDLDIRLTACAGPADAEACSHYDFEVHTASWVEPVIEVTDLTATATGPTTIEARWRYGATNIGINIVFVRVSSTDPPTEYSTGLSRGEALTYATALPGVTYTIEVSACGGPTPSSLVCSAPASTTVTTPDPTGTLSGTVRDEGGQPIAGATVAAYAPTDGWTPTASTTAEPDGTYTFEDISTGDYAVVALGPPGSGTGLAWHGGSGRGDADLVTVGEGASVTGIDIALPTTEAISGTVTSGGSGLAGATVWAFAPGDVWFGSAFTSTAADGSYQLDGIKAGTYKIAVVPPAGTGPITWFDGSSTRGDATPIEITAAMPATGIDVDIAASP